MAMAHDNKWKQWPRTGRHWATICEADSRGNQAIFCCRALGVSAPFKACSQFFDSHVMMELHRLCDRAEPQWAIQKPTTPASNDRRIASLPSMLRPTGKEAGRNAHEHRSRDDQMSGDGQDHSHGDRRRSRKLSCDAGVFCTRL